MRILALLSVMLLAGVLLTGCIQSEPAAPTVGVVDTARVFRDSDAGKGGVKFLEGLHEKMQGELNAIQDTLQKNPNDMAAQAKLQETYMSLQQRMGAEQQNVITLLNDAAQRAMDTYRTQKKLLIVLGSEAALSFDKAVDITAEVIAEMNKQKLEFKALQPEAPAAAPAKEAPVQAPATPAPAKEAPAKNATKAAPAKK